MRWKYKASLTIVGLGLIFSLLLLVSYYKYLQEQENTAIVIVDNGLSINYMQGNQVRLTSNQSKTYTFSITNNSENSMRYFIYLDNLNANKETIRYDLKESKGKLKINQNNLQNDAYLANLIEIAANETHSYTLTLHEIDKGNMSGTIKIGIEGTTEEYFASTIMSNNEIKKEPKTEIGEEIATENEGLIETNDDHGLAYYFRGNVNNNYVTFAGLTWRIVKINGDGSIKLVLNNYTDITANFYEENSELAIEDKLVFTKTNINTKLTEWYKARLSEYDTYLVSGKFCIDNRESSTENDIKYYQAGPRLKIDYAATYNCEATSTNERIGLLSADEVLLAGGSVNSDNTSYYLYTPEKEVAFWTLTPYSSDASNVSYFEVGTNGKLQTEAIGSYYRGLKPVINLLKKTYVTGKGTEDDPYMIKE